MNVCTFIGNLTADPILKTFDRKGNDGGEGCVAKFRIAVNTRRGKTEKAAFLKCEAWDRQGRFVSDYFKKGEPIAVVAQIEDEEWEDKEGNRRFDKKFNCIQVDFVRTRRARNGEDESDSDTDAEDKGRGESAASPKASGKKPRRPEPEPDADDAEDGDEEIKF